MNFFLYIPLYCDIIVRNLFSRIKEFVCKVQLWHLILGQFLICKSRMKILVSPRVIISISDFVYIRDLIRCLLQKASIHGGCHCYYCCVNCHRSSQFSTTSFLNHSSMLSTFTLSHRELSCTISSD